MTFPVHVEPCEGQFAAALVRAAGGAERRTQPG